MLRSSTSATAVSRSSKASCRSSSLSFSDFLPCTTWFSSATRCSRRLDDLASDRWLHRQRRFAARDPRARAGASATDIALVLGNGSRGRSRRETCMAPAIPRTDRNTRAFEARNSLCRSRPTGLQCPDLAPVQPGEQGLELRPVQRHHAVADRLARRRWSPPAACRPSLARCRPRTGSSACRLAWRGTRTPCR